MKPEKHLPIYGPGPFYVGTITALTLAAFCLRNLPLFAAGRLEAVYPALAVLGAVFITAGVSLWIYAAAMIVCTGAIFLIGNAWFFILPFLYWLFMTILMKVTEEKWLNDLYGKEYEDYCGRVNRCWPWLPRG